MEKHKCKLCLKSFANGRALGGHMRSHMRNLYVHPKPPHHHSPPPSYSSESSRNATARRRSKRIRRPENSWFGDQQHFREFDRNKNQNLSEYLKKLKTPESSTAEPVSSISDTSPEEDLAYCLILLSRDKWTNEEEEDQEHEDTEPGSESVPPARAKYRCETCNKIFRSYQALGGHRASHKKIKQSHHEINHQTQKNSIEDKIHECPVCFKVFASGQALGGHKRSHITASSSLSMATNKDIVKQSIHPFDLNLPASTDDEDDEVSQIEVSVVSDGEFVKPH